MNKKLFKFEISGFIFVSIIGTLSHFFFDLSNENKFVALFSPVNESPWEHLKMLFFPFLVFTIFTVIKLKSKNAFIAGYISIITGMWATLSYFYTLNGAIGGNNEWVNLSSFFVGILIAFVINYFMLNNAFGRGNPDKLGLALFTTTALLFFLFTFKPPLIPLFQDPTSSMFGI